MNTICEIVVVNYRTCKMTTDTVQSIIDNEKEMTIKIHLIDNNSGDSEVEYLSQYAITSQSTNCSVLFKSNTENLGFAKANNLALKSIEGDFVVLLNSDTRLTTNSFTKAVKYLQESPDIGALGCRLITPDGKLDHGCKRGFPTPKASLFYFLKMNKWLKRPELDLYRLGHLDEHKVHDVDVISGAFMVIPKRVIDEVGLLDERFFMYGEDIDWCYRIKEAGYRVVYNPELGDVIHYKGASGKKRKFKTLFNFYEAMILFYNKHYLKKYNILVTICVYLGILLQFMLKLIWNYRPRFNKRS